MAKTAQINIKINTSDGVKNVGDLNNEINSSVKSISSLEAEFERLSEEINSVEVGSDKFKQLQGELKSVDSELKNTKKSVEGLDFEAKAGEIGKFAGGVGAVGTALAVSFGDNKDIEAFFKTFAQGIAITQGLKGAMEAAASAQKLFNLASIKGGLIQLKDTVVTVAKTVALGASVAATAAATAAQWLWNAAMTANPIGLIIVGIGALIGGIVLLVKNIDSVIGMFSDWKSILLAMLGPIGWLILGYQALFGEEQKNSNQIAENAKKERAIRDQKIKDIDKQRDAESRAFNSRQTAYDLEIDRMEAEGKASFELKKQKLQDIIDEKKAILKSSNDKLQVWIDYYTNIARLQGKTDEEFKASMKNRGIDLDKMLNKVLAGQKKQKNEIFAAETDIIKLKREHNAEEVLDNEEKNNKILNDDLLLAKIKLDQAKFNAKQDGKFSREELDNIYKLTLDFLEKEKAAKLSNTELTEAEKAAIEEEYRERGIEAENNKLKEEQKIKEEELKKEEELNKKRIKNNELLSKTKLDQAKFNAKQDGKISQEELDDIYKLTLDFLDKEKAAKLSNTELTEAEKAAIEEEYRQKGIEAEKEKNSKISINDNKTAQNKKALKKALFEESVKIAKETFDAIKEIQDRKSQEKLAKIDEDFNNENEALKASLANREISQSQYDERMALANQKKKQREIAEKRKAFKQKKAMALVDVAISTAQAIMSALTTTPAPVGIVLAASAGITGGIEAGLIASQKFKAANGGVVPGAPSMTDSVDALLAPGEMVINSNSAQMFPQTLSAINQAGGGVSLAPEMPVKSQQVFNNNKQAPVKAIVVESDITDMQKKASRIENGASF